MTGWTESKFGRKTRCYRSFGEHKIEQAKQKCRDFRAWRPLPRSHAEQADFLATLDSMGIGRLGTFIVE